MCLVGGRTPELIWKLNYPVSIIAIDWHPNTNLIHPSNGITEQCFDSTDNFELAKHLQIIISNMLHRQHIDWWRVFVDLVWFSKYHKNWNVVLDFWTLSFARRFSFRIIELINLFLLKFLNVDFQRLAMTIGRIRHSILKLSSKNVSIYGQFLKTFFSLLIIRRSWDCINQRSCKSNIVSCSLVKLVWKLQIDSKMIYLDFACNGIAMNES